LAIENNDNVNDNNTITQQTPPSIDESSSPTEPQPPGSESQDPSDNVYDVERQQPPSPFVTSEEEEPGSVSGSGESSLTDEITKSLEENDRLRQEVVELWQRLDRLGNKTSDEQAKRQGQQIQQEFLSSSPSSQTLEEEPMLDSSINKSALDRQINEHTPFSSTESNSTKDSNGPSEISKMLAKIDL
jgi:hypothetical protein